MNLKLLIALTILFCSELQAQEVSLGTVIVNASIEDDTTAESASFSSIIKKDSSSATDDVSSMIEKETSIQVKQSGGIGSFSSVSMRGASSNQVMVFLDGVPLNDASGSAVDLSSIPYSEISSIEVYRGNTPITLGKGGIGGAVNIKTLKASNRTNANINTSYSSFNTFKLAPTISQKFGRFDYLINTEYVSSKNNFTFLNDKGTAYNPADDKWEQRNNSQFSHVNVLTNFGYDINKDVRLELSEQFFDKDQNLPSQNNSPLTKTKLSTRRNITAIKLNYFNSSSRLDYTYKNEYYDNKDGTSGLTKQYTRYTTNNYGYNQTLEAVQKNNIFDFVFDVHREEYRARDLLLANPTTTSYRNNYTTSIEDKVLLLNESLIIVPGITFEYYGTTLENNHSNYSHGYFNPKLGVKYGLTNALSLKTNLAKYTREPSFFELIGNRGYFIGNDTLKAERGVNFDIGGEFKTSNIKLELAYFRSNVKDVISYVYDSSGTGHAVNISNSAINGIETTFLIDFLKYFSLNTNYTWQQPINQSKVQLYDGKKLPGRFEHSFFSRLEAKAWMLKPYYEFLYASGLYYDSANLLPAPVKREHNLGLTFFIDKVTLTAEVKNIGDDHYEDFNGFPTPGRSYWLTANYSF